MLQVGRTMRPGLLLPASILKSMFEQRATFWSAQDLFCPSPTALHWICPIGTLPG